MEFISENQKTDVLPMMALRGLSVFPNMILSFDVEREKSIAALNAASDGNRKIFLLSQKDIAVEDPERKDLYDVGTVCHIKQFLRMPSGGIKVLVEGLTRARLIDVVSSKRMFTVHVEVIPEYAVNVVSPKHEALIRKAFDLFEEYCGISSTVSRETALGVLALSDPGRIADYITQNVFMKIEKKQKVLETLQPAKRLELVCDLLNREIEVLGIEQDIDEKLKDRLGRQQRDNVLREQMRVIRSELGEDPDYDNEIDDYREKIRALGLDGEIEAKLLKETDRLEKQQFGSAEASVIRNYLDICLELPWKTGTKEHLDVRAAAKILDEDHYGLDKVKERILEFLAVRQHAPEIKGTILCLVGPPGVGKTSVAISVARALNRKLVRLPLGGIHDEAEIRGHRKTYVGAMPGRIISGLIQAKSNNPLMLLDEIDKLGSDYRGDPSAALLEALDPEQNRTFRDNFLELPFDLSNVMFITTANNSATIPAPLLDRMEVIELSSYTDLEKLEIAKRHLIPKQRKMHALSGNQLRIPDDVIRDIISSYTRESGVRQLERQISKICRKTVSGIVTGDIKSLRMKESDLEKYLGTRKFKPDAMNASDEVGIVRGLAWTSVGGETLEVEVNILNGTGKLELTGNLGDVMKESARAAVSYIRSRADQLGIPEDFYKTKDIHIHFPESAVPKDGPSAGITMAIAVISALTETPVRCDIAMTGEISLRGRILAIGGLKEKTMAALRAGITTVIIPADNEPDLDEIDPVVRSSLSFITAKNIDSVLEIAMPMLRINDRKAADPAAVIPVRAETCKQDAPASVCQ